MQNENIQNLMERCMTFFRDNSYTEHRISRYKSLWRTGIIRYMTENNIDNYSHSVGTDFISTCHNEDKVLPQNLEKIRSVQVLDEMLSLGYIRRRRITHVFHELKGPIGMEMEKLISHLTKLRRSQKTIKMYRLYLSDFLTYLNVTGVKTVAEIAENHILTFISSRNAGQENIMTTLHNLFRFWWEHHIVNGNLDDFIESYKLRKKEKIPSFYTPEEVLAVEKSVSRSSGVGKRNYAMLLLASRLGLRASDIANLQFSNIDWDNNLITLVMKKTGKLIELPLLAEIGNAIIEYLQDGRPQSKLQHVFLSSKAPYVAATSVMVGTAINTIICKSGINITGKHHGPHSLRHSLASKMLTNGTAMPVISESLGHRSSESTRSYLKIDIKSLQQCALPVPPISEDFYKQEGGAFYG